MNQVKNMGPLLVSLVVASVVVCLLTANADKPPVVIFGWATLVVQWLVFSFLLLSPAPHEADKALIEMIHHNASTIRENATRIHNINSALAALVDVSCKSATAEEKQMVAQAMLRIVKPAE